MVMVVAVCAISLAAQDWCPPGARWTYTDSSLVDGVAGYHVTEYVGDTIISGTACKKLVNTRNQLIGGSVQSWPSYFNYTYSAGGVAQVINQQLNGWDTLYWFTAAPGDHWGFPHFNDFDECNWMTVVDTGSVLINGWWLHYLDCTMDSVGIQVQRRITELLGDEWYFRPIPMCTGPFEIKHGLRCYSDDAFGSYSTGIAPTCDHTNGVPEPWWGEVDAIVPNPGTDHFTLSPPPGTHTITLFDATGRIAVQRRARDGPVTIHTDQLPSGIYVVSVDEGLQPLRWVKQ